MQPGHRSRAARTVGATVAVAALLSVSIAAAAAGDGPGANVVAPSERLGDPVEIPVDHAVGPRRAIMISDSVLAGVAAYGQTDRLTGTEWYTVDAVCRRLVGTSCKATGFPRPPNLLTELSRLPFTPDRYDLFVVATGYNDWAGALDANFDLIVSSIRARGFEQIAWLNHHTEMGGSDGANYAEMNTVLTARAASDADVHIWDFKGAAAGQPWFAGDRTHLSPTGAGPVADWLSARVTTINVAD